ncbi:MAG: hypothetical protein PF542_03760 [Nanoarchaeota archaeon]|jgi:antitoxin component of RelBE/YafQ-DinJ toxin-antitoxin module|nr:hypothetical protein [Nanoarchaeota archaeon]
MVLKTFNVEEEFYKKFSDYCKENGFSMSQQVNLFIKTQIEEEPKVRESYLRKLERIRKQDKFIEVKNFSERYDL